MKPLTAGDLRHTVVVKRPNRTADGKGGYTKAWDTIATFRAEVLGLDGRESVMEHVLEGISVYRIRLRWRSGLTIKASDQALVDGALELNIKGPAADPDGRRRQLVFMADTGSAEAMA